MYGRTRYCKFLKTDKDNVFVSFKTSTVDQMSYVRNIALKYESETQCGLKTTVEVKHSTDEPTGGFLNPLHGQKYKHRRN